ncbi:MAG: SufBD protein [Anaerolineae bacterium]|nr:SufBD protein [Anaerolineae bacterium]
MNASRAGRRPFTVADEFEAIVRSYERAGGSGEHLLSPRFASMVVSGNTVLSTHELPGVEMRADQLEDGVSARVRVAPGTRVELPVHLCFGVLPERGVQRILPVFEIGEGASVEFLAHCTFPNSVEVLHLMEAEVLVGSGARMRYSETHFHGERSGARVVPHGKIVVQEAGAYLSEFTLTEGRIGSLEFDYTVEVGAKGRAELMVRAHGYGDDRLRIVETIKLNGRGARGLAKSRIAVREDATSEVLATTEGNAPESRGHVDCVEIVRDRAMAGATPVVRVRNDSAYVTHEAAIGTVNKKELETLMARGLDEEAAVDVIVGAMLRG